MGCRIQPLKNDRLSSRAKRGISVLAEAAVTVAQANPQIPRFARDDNVLLGLWSDS